MTVLLPWPVAAQEAYVPSPQNVAARKWFQDARFGLFIHWGVSSVLMDGEWVMENRGIRISEYERLTSEFDPAEFDADAWVSLAREAGMRYVTLITKHHDGFALWDSEVSDWNVVDRTPFGRDIVAEMAEACRRQGLRLFVYYSQLDWHDLDYFPRGRTGHATGRPDEGNWDRYLETMDAQLRELFTGYGPLGGVWFDGMWDRPDADWQLERTYQMIHELQPAALIMSNHHEEPRPGEDVQTFEKDLPGANTAGWNDVAVSTELPLETAETIGASWGFSITDRSFKSVRDLIRMLVNAAGRNANLLLNVGPLPDGTIHPEHAERLRGIGRWLDRYGESVYGTRGGPIPPRPWGVTTHRGDTVYVLVLDWADPALALPRLPRPVRAARSLADGADVTFDEGEAGVVLQLPPPVPESVVRVIVLELEPDSGTTSVQRAPAFANGP
jgi:alpha-L-fucosidase